MRYRVMMKNGVTLAVTSVDKTKNPIGLWIWALRQVVPQVINFQESAVLASEIAMMEPIEELEPFE